MSQQEGVTVFMTLFAAVAICLSRYTGQTDILIGSPISNRLRPEVEGLIGFFVNTLVLRADLSGDPSVRKLLQRIRVMTLEAFDHQDVPFEHLFKVLQPARDLSRSPIFQVMFAFGIERGQEIYPFEQQQELVIEPMEVPTGMSKFDLTFGIGEYGESLSGGVEYRTDLFDASMIDHMIGHLKTVLMNMVKDPGQRLSSLKILTEPEHGQLLVEWNHTTQAYPKDLCVHQLFEAQVVRTPEAVAAVCAGKQLTYHELNDRADQMAFWLRELGVGPDVIVGLYVERSLEMVVGVLGILKAGGAYLPLDPTYPQERLRFLLEDAQPRVLLTQDHLASTIPSSQAQIVSLDSQDRKLSRPSSNKPYSQVKPHNLAYVIYTSGSTGRPKGVLIEHRGLVNHCIAISSHFDLSPMDRVLQFASLSFDFAAEEIFPSLASGSTLILRTDEAIASIKEFIKFLQTERITVVDLPTPFWHEWVEQLTELVEPISNTVRLVVVGGDAVLSDRFHTWRHIVGDQVRWCNTYGPTEATITATLYEPILGELGEEPVSVPIGRPIPNVKAFVLDRRGQLAPIGIPGELHLAGVGLARGYLNRPELTQEKFIGSTLDEIPRHLRLYKTGDLVRYRSDGILEFLGRLDNQVKIRGFRVELGEIETTLRQHPSVQEVAVLARDESEGDKRLVAYVIGKPEVNFDSKVLREFLKRHLPAYMIPSAFVPLSALPQTSNGKIDYQAIASLPLNRGHEASYAPPQNDLETKMTRIWEEILNFTPIGRDENFFSLGGHSLLAVRLFSRVEKEFGESLSLATIFHAPTIVQLTSMLTKTPQRVSGTSLVPIQPTGSLPPLFVVHLVGGNVLTYGDLSHYLGPDQPLYGLQSVGLDGSNKPFTRVEDMAAHYIREIRTVQGKGPYFLAGGCMGGLVAFEMAQQFLAKGEKVAFLGLIESWLPQGDESSFYVSPWVSHLYGGIKSQIKIAKQIGFRNWLPQGATKVQKILAQKDIYGGNNASRYRDLVTAANARALSLYIPKPYQGAINYFLASGREVPDGIDSRLEWTNLVAGGLQSIQISAPNAGQMFMPPYVQELAQQLGICLEEARRKANINSITMM